MNDRTHSARPDHPELHTAWMNFFIENAFKLLDEEQQQQTIVDVVGVALDDVFHPQIEEAYDKHVEWATRTSTTDTRHTTTDRVDRVLKVLRDEWDPMAPPIREAIVHLVTDRPTLDPEEFERVGDDWMATKVFHNPDSIAQPWSSSSPSPASSATPTRRCTAASSRRPTRRGTTTTWPAGTAMGSRGTARPSSTPRSAPCAPATMPAGSQRRCAASSVTHREVRALHRRWAAAGGVGRPAGHSACGSRHGLQGPAQARQRGSVAEPIADRIAIRWLGLQLELIDGPEALAEPA